MLCDFTWLGHDRSNNLTLIIADDILFAFKGFSLIRKFNGFLESYFWNPSEFVGLVLLRL